MNAEVREETVAVAEDPPSPSIGARLTAAREAKGMTLGDVAQALKLGVRQVEALEAGRWEALPGATFIRGFARNYARLLEIDPAPRMVELDGVLDLTAPRLDRPHGPQTPMPAPTAGRRRDFAVVGFGLGLVVLALLLYFVLPTDFGRVVDGLRGLVQREAPQDTAPPSPSAAPEPVLPPGATPQQVLNPQAIPVGDAASVPQSAVAAVEGASPAPAGLAAPSTAVVAPSQASSAGVTGATGALRLVVERESWVEVKDGEGNLLLSQKLPAGSEHSVEGRGRLWLVIGNASGVRLSFRGQAVDLAPHTRGEVARLTLE